MITFQKYAINSFTTETALYECKLLSLHKILQWEGHRLATTETTLECQIRRIWAFWLHWASG